MEIRNKLLILITLIISFLYLTFTKKKKDNFTFGSKIANTEYIKNTKYFKIKLRKYKILKGVINGLFVIAIISSILLLGRLAKTTKSKLQSDRDIILCMDVSSSVDNSNLELITNFKRLVNNLQGDRIAISIFNTTSVTLSPLTNDYTYINNILDTITKSIKANNPDNYGQYTGNDYLYIKNYIISGTLENYEERGTSLIGDGIASCIYNFDDNNRDKIIISSTDNNPSGKETLTLLEASRLGKKKNIRLFGITTKDIPPNKKEEYLNATTNGNLYDETNIDKLITQLDKEETHKNKDSSETTYDIPTIPYIILLISTSLIIISKKVIL